MEAFFGMIIIVLWCFLVTISIFFTFAGIFSLELVPVITGLLGIGISGLILDKVLD